MKLVLQAFIVATIAGVCTAAQALALPVDHHYELVSPLYKGGYGVLGLDDVAIAGASAEGNRVVFESLGAFKPPITT